MGPVSHYDLALDVFTILKMTADGLEALSCHHAVIKNEKYAEFYIFDDTQKMASAMND